MHSHPPSSPVHAIHSHHKALRAGHKWWTLTLTLAMAAGGIARAAAIGDDPGTPPPPPPTPTEATGTQPTAPTTTPVETMTGPQTTVVPPASPDDAVDEEPETQITLLDGRQISGFLIRQDDAKVYLRVAGIDSPFPRSEIVRTEVLASVSQRYREMRAAISDSDADRLVLLAEWLRMRHRYDDALREVEAALKADPDHRYASELKVLIAKQRELALMAKAKAATRENAAVTRQGAAAGASSKGQPDAFPRISPEDVNIIRVYEVDLKNVPRMVISRELVEELLKTHGPGVFEALKDRFNGSDLMRLIVRKGNDVEAFRDNEVVAAIASLPASAFLEIMFDSRVRARELYAKVRVIEDPAAMKMFRDSVHGAWLHNNCATSKCHGGEDAGRLWLATRQPNSDATVYTNFLILNSFKLADGTPLLDMTKPEASPLMQLGLLRKVSKFPHPPVPRGTSKVDAWRPVFRETSERRYQEAMQWIGALYRPRPEYPVKYTPPIPSGMKSADPKHSPDEPGR